MPIAPSGDRRRAAQQRNPAPRGARAQRDDALVPRIERGWQANPQGYGADQAWRPMNREGIAVARRTVARLLRRLGRRGVIRGKVVRTTFGDRPTPRPLDRVDREFKAARPNPRWVADFT